MDIHLSVCGYHSEGMAIVKPATRAGCPRWWLTIKSLKESMELLLATLTFLYCRQGVARWRRQSVKSQQTKIFQIRCCILDKALTGLLWEVRPGLKLEANEV